jgi:hypothetical protein
MTTGAKTRPFICTMNRRHPVNAPDDKELLLHATRCPSEHGIKTEDNMPILLWLLGVPLSLIVVLMLFGGI